MSTGPIEATTGANPDKAIENATDDANAHTPDPPVTAPPPDDKADASNADSGLAELRETVAALGDSVATLTNLVTRQATPDEGAHDKLPWLLRGKKGIE